MFSSSPSLQKSYVLDRALVLDDMVKGAYYNTGEVWPEVLYQPLYRVARSCLENYPSRRSSVQEVSSATARAAAQKAGITEELFRNVHLITGTSISELFCRMYPVMSGNVSVARLTNELVISSNTVISCSDS